MGIFKAIGWFVTGGAVRPTTTRERSRMYQRRANNLLEEQLYAIQDLGQQQGTQVPTDSRPRGTCPACLELMLVGASTCPHCHTTGVTWPSAPAARPPGITWPSAPAPNPQTVRKKERKRYLDRHWNHKEITEQEIAANQKAHLERELNSRLDESQLLMSRYSDLMSREGLSTIDELRARLGQSLEKASDKTLDNDTVTTVTFSRQRMTEAKKCCSKAISELRILVEAAIDPTRGVQVSELELRNSFDLAKKTLKSYSLMSNVGVQQYEETISSLAIDVSVKFGYLHL